MAKDPREKHVLKSSKTSQYSVHPTVVIERDVVIGDDSKILQFSHLMEGCTIGTASHIGQNVSLSPRVTLGNHVTIQNQVNIESGVTCEDHVFLGHGVVFTNVNDPRGELVQQSTIIREGATISTNSSIQTGVEIGKYSFIKAGTVVTNNVKPFALIEGSNGNQVGWVSKQGKTLDLPLTSNKKEPVTATCPETQEVYMLDGDQVILGSTAHATV
jgi:UDP-2-acetamido-3-amino-2,3-dideoxy-glucuronate N-acetyltransferase